MMNIWTTFEIVNSLTWASLLLLSCSLLRCLSRSIRACSAGLGIGATGLVVGGVTVCGGAGAGLGCRGATGAAGAALSTGAGLLNNSSREFKQIHKCVSISCKSPE